MKVYILIKMGGLNMKCNLPKNIASNSQKCPKCNKLMTSFWWGYRCKRCSYEQLNREGRDWKESMNKVEVL